VELIDANRRLSDKLHEKKPLVEPLVRYPVLRRFVGGVLSSGTNMSSSSSPESTEKRGPDIFRFCPGVGVVHCEDLEGGNTGLLAAEKKVRAEDIEDVLACTT
jgi:hypothetical protein